MQAAEYVFCPYCGQQFEILLDLSAGSHRLTTDCEVCCRPIDVNVTVRDGELGGLDVCG